MVEAARATCGAVELNQLLESRFLPGRANDHAFRSNWKFPPIYPTTYTPPTGNELQSFVEWLADNPMGGLLCDACPAYGGITKSE